MGSKLVHIKKVRKSGDCMEKKLTSSLSASFTVAPTSQLSSEFIISGSLIDKFLKDDK